MPAMNTGSPYLTNGWLILALLLFTGCGEKKVATTPGTINSTPLAPMEGKDAPLFEKLDPASTGLTRAPKIDPKHPERRLYATGYSVGGIAVGDVNNDNKPDIFISSGPGQNRLYLQDEPLTFRDITEASGIEERIAWSSGATMADVNNDGLLDIYVCNYDEENALFINKGITDGIPAYLDEAKVRKARVRDASHTPAFCDYDNDGDLDLFILMHQLVAADGTAHTIPDAYAVGKRGNAFVIPRYTLYFKIDQQLRDPETDQRVATLKAIGRPDMLLENDGEGNFVNVTKKAGIESEGIGYAVQWRDYNLDGRPDLYIANGSNEPDHLYHNNGDGTFTDVIDTVVPLLSSRPRGLASSDFDHDGRPDTLIAHATNPHKKGENITFGQVSRNTLQLFSHTNRIHEAALMSGLSETGYAWSALGGDVNNDGLPDAIFTTGHVFDLDDTNLFTQINMQEGETTWDAYTRAEAPRMQQKNRVLQNNGDLNFIDRSAAWGLDAKGVSHAAVQHDLDGDGDLDLITLNFDTPPSIYRNNSAGGHRVLVTLEGPAAYGSTVIIETAKGRLARQVIPNQGFLGSTDTTVHFGLDSAPIIEHMEIIWANGHYQSFDDLQVDHHYRLTAPSGSPNTRSAATPPLLQPFSGLQMARHNEKELGRPGELPLYPVPKTQLGPGIAAGDVDGDGDEDFVLGGARGFDLQIIRNDGNGIYRPQRDEVTGGKDREDAGILLIDVDADTDLDLIVASGGIETKFNHPVYRDQVFINDGNGHFSEAPERTPAIYRSTLSAITADIDRDGDLDLFTGRIIVADNYTNAPVSQILVNEDGIFSPADWSITGAVAAALFSDVDADGFADLLVAKANGPIHLHTNEQGILSQNAIEIAPSAPWRSLTGRDIDGDNDIDYVAGSNGQNTWQTRSNSGLLINQGNRSFTFNPLPRAVQRSPLNGAVFTELTGDTLPELLVLQNEFAVRIDREPMPNGSGVLLINQGKEVFRSTTVEESGLEINGTGKCILVTDFNEDGKPDILIALNDDHLKAYKTNRDGVFSITLQGKPGNLQGIGSRVMVTLANGKTQVAEVYGGEGYLSQSSGSLFFGLDGSEVQSIDIHWPTGKMTRHQHRGETRLTIKQP